MSIRIAIKKLFIWSFIAAILGGGFLGIFTKTYAAVLTDQERINLITPCAYSINGNRDESDVITFGAITTTNDGKTIKINATVGNASSSKEYVYNYESSEETGSSEGTLKTYVDYYFKNSVYSNSKLKINGVYDPDDKTLTTTAYGIEITNYSGISDSNYKTFAEKFNDRVGRNINMSCQNAGSIFGNEPYDTSITFNGDSAPTIKIAGNATLSRPAMEFKLSYALNLGGSAINNDVFLFTYNGNDSKYKNIAVKIFPNGSGFITECSDFNNYQRCYDFAGAKVKISNLMAFLNHVYNPPASTGSSSTCDNSNLTIYVSSNPDKKLANWTSTPDQKCLNGDSNGWLVKWGVKITSGSFTNPTGAIGEETCGLPITKIATAEYWIAKALCGILGIIADLSEMLINELFKTVFNAYHPPNNLKLSSLDLKLSFLTTGFSISTAHAATDAADNEVSPLNQAFTNSPSNKWGWVIPVWKFVLGLTDLFLVVILLFLGVVNILHIQYDTYAIKKMLPLLIIGVILANFSLVIMRMLIDASNVLTTSFMGGPNPGDAVHSLILNFGLSKSQLPSFAIGWKTVGGLFLSLFFSIFVIAAFLILGVMFYIRYAAIILLGIAAPLAFICLAFPPTQSVFKQWWSWTTKFVFMKPIAMFFIMVAIKIKESGGGASLTGWIIITALVYMAIIVPWKLGGAVMAMWGGAMGTLFGTKKGGWARKPVEEWAGRRKGALGNMALERLPFLKRSIGAATLDKERVEGKRKRLVNEGMLDTERKKGKWTERERMRDEQAERDYKGYKDQTRLQILEVSDEEEKDKLKKSWWARQGFKMKTGTKTTEEFAANWAISVAKANNAAEAISKTAQFQLYAQLSANQQLDSKLRDTLKSLIDQNQATLDDVNLDNLEVDGTITFNPDIKIGAKDYDVYAEEIRKEAEKESDPTKKANLLASADDIEKRASEWRAAHPSTGIKRGWKINTTTGELEDSDKMGSYADAMQDADVLTLMGNHFETIDKEKAKKFYNSATELRQRAQDFRKNNQTFVDVDGKTKLINYDDFQSRNIVGRQLKQLTPLLIDEMHTNAQNENTSSMLDTLINGGGFGNIRIFDGKKIGQFMRGEQSKLSSNEKNAIMAILGGLKERLAMSPDRSDAQELLNGFLKTSTGKDYLGRGLWTNLLKKLETDRSGTIGEFILEYAARAQERGDETIFGDEIKTREILEKYLDRRTGRLKPNAVANFYKEYGGGDALGIIDNFKIDTDIIGKLVPSGIGAGNQHQREFFRRIVTQILQMPEFGGGRNPAMWGGTVRDTPGNKLFSTLKPNVSSSTGGQETINQAIRDEQQAIEIANSSYDQLEQKAGGSSARVVEVYAPGIEYAVKMRPPLVSSIFPEGTQVNPLDDAMNEIIEGMAQVDPNATREQLQATLERINGNLKFELRPNISVGDYVTNARIVSSGERTLDQAMMASEAEGYSVYGMSAPQNKVDLDKTVEALKETNAALSEIAASITSGGPQTGGVTKEQLDTFLKGFEQTPAGQIPVVKEKVTAELNAGNLGNATGTIARFLAGYLAAQQIKDNDEEITPAKLKRVMMSAFEAERLARRQAEAVQPPAPGAPTPPATPSSTPSAPSAPAGPDEDRPESIP